MSHQKLWHVQLILCLYWFHMTLAEWTPTTDICNVDSHCLNGGKCMPANDVTNFRHCHCQDGFSGPRCSRFCPFDCQNGGYCRVTPLGAATGLREPSGPYNPDNYMCKCFGHFTGSLCEIPYSNCGDEERCYNGGRCVLGEDMVHRCSCPQGYGGNSCETPVAVKADSEIVTEEGKIVITVLSIMLLFLGATLFILVQRKRLSPPPKFIIVNDDPGEKIDYRDGIYRDRDHTSGRIMLNVI
jgi:hypothetical protein